MAEPTCRLDRFAKQGEQKAEKLVLKRKNKR